MAGGTFLTQNRVRAGVYINFRSAGRKAAAVGSRGTAALPMEIGFGPAGKLLPVTADTDVRKLFGYRAGDPALLLLQECAKRAGTVLAYRLAEGGKASCTGGNLTATAKYGGSRGNALAVRITAEAGAFRVETLLDGEALDVQHGTEVSDLSANSWVEFSGSGALSPQAGLVLSGGTDEKADAESYRGFFKALETADFQTFALPSDDMEVIREAAAFTVRMREQEGKKIQAVVAGYPQANHEGVISVKNGVLLENGTELTAAQATAFAAGMTAGAQVNESNTYGVYDGAADVRERMTGSEIEAALKAGEWVFLPKGNRVVLEQDINTFTAFSPEKGRAFSKNRLLRVMDGLAEDLKRLFEEQYLGKTGNSADGRSLFRAEVLGYLQQLAEIGAIDGTGPEDVEVLPGQEADAVTVNLQLRPVDSMEKLYMTVEIR